MDDVQTKLLALANQIDIDSLSLNEIAARLGLKYRSQAKHYKEKAEQDGTLVRNGNGRLVAAPSLDNPTLITLPVIGAANCGPAATWANDTVTGTVRLSPSIFKRKLRKGVFAVRAIGDSMNNARINGKPLNNGDLAIVEPLVWDEAGKGDYILSVIDGLANIKRLDMDTTSQTIILRSESREFFEDILIAPEDLYMYTISGRVIGVIENKQAFTEYNERS